MPAWHRVLYLLAGAAAALVAVSSVVLAIRQGSWAPIVSVGWIPAVIIAIWPGTHRRCGSRWRSPAR